MARKRAVFFRELYSFLTSAYFLRVYRCVRLLTLAVVLSQVSISGMPVLLAEPIAFFEGEAAQSSARKQLVQRGREYYQAGQFTEAATVWKQAAEAFAAQGDRLNQAMLLSNLSLVYQQLGQWSGATTAGLEGRNKG